MTTSRRVVELVAIVACFIALREVLGRVTVALSQATHSAWSSVAFYMLWLVPCAFAARAWGWPRRWPGRTAWTAASVAIALGVLGFVDWLYGFKLARTLTGDFWFGWPASVAMAVNAALAAPIVEELIFRGVLWNGIQQRSNRATALVVTSMLFAIFHWKSIFEPSWYGAGMTPLYAHALFGAAMGTLRWRLDAIGLGLVIHVLFNTMWVVSVR